MHGERHTRVRLHDAAGLDGGRKIASPLIPFLLGVRAFLFIFICWFSVHMWTKANDVARRDYIGRRYGLMSTVHLNILGAVMPHRGGDEMYPKEMVNNGLENGTNL